MRRAPTGQQWQVGTAEQGLTVTEVGGTLRSWRHAGREVLAGFDEAEPCSSGRGQQLTPWPNRIRDGRYRFGGVEHQLTLSEPHLHNASHGLVRWAAWELLDSDDGSLTVGHELHPQPGWDWSLDLQTRYAATASGLHVSMRATNVSDTAAPFGAAQHPYVGTGPHFADQITLTVPARTWVETDDRLLPMARRDVADTRYDFTSPRTIGAGWRLDTAFTDVVADSDGRWRVVVEAPEQPQVTVWADADAFGWLQVFTGKIEPDASGQRGVAIEPMTCPADAFNSGDALTLEPGESWSGEWGMTVG